MSSKSENIPSINLNYSALITAYILKTITKDENCDDDSKIRLSNITYSNVLHDKLI